MIFTFDDYYNIEEINSFIQNGKEYIKNQYISRKDYKLYIECENLPIFLKYTEIPNVQRYFLLSRVHPLQSQEELIYTRRNTDANKSVLRLAQNDAFKYFKKDYVYFLNLNKEKAQNLSNHIGRIYYFGKYLGKFRIFLTNSKYITNFVNIDEILCSGSPFEAELELNYNVFNLRDRLFKYSQTPYFENGEYFSPKILGKRYKSNK